MKPLIKISLIVFLLHSINCLSEPGDGSKRRRREKKDKQEEKLWTTCWYSAIFFPPRPSNQIIDNRDGTISLAEVYSREPCDALLRGNNQLRITVKASMKKCIQGQVYRSAQNDCKGTGSAANYYGAQKLQFCPTNISTCGDLSPAKISCKNDTTGGGNHTGGFHNFVSYYKEIKDYFKSRKDEIPSLPSDYYWDSGSKVAFNIDNELANPTPNFDSFQYVLCY